MKIKELPKDAVRVKDSKDFVDKKGTVYSPVTNYKGRFSGEYLIKTPHNCNGYFYVAIYDNEMKSAKSRRLNRVVAETFIPNPHNLPVVGHKNNIKTDNRVENLYWTTYKENSQKAVDDGLLVNAKGKDDNQSMPVVMFSSDTNEKIGVYGSIKEASRLTSISASTISRQCRNERQTKNSCYFRFLKTDTPKTQTLVGMYDYESDELLRTFRNYAEASKITNTKIDTVSRHCTNGKPKQNVKGFYFRRILDKCEQTIEKRKLSRVGEGEVPNPKERALSCMTDENMVDKC